MAALPRDMYHAMLDGDGVLVELAVPDGFGGTNDEWATVARIIDAGQSL